MTLCVCFQQASHPLQGSTVAWTWTWTRTRTPTRAAHIPVVSQEPTCPHLGPSPHVATGVMSLTCPQRPEGDLQNITGK